MNKISKSLMALMTTGILFFADATMAATPVAEALPTLSGPVAPQGSPNLYKEKADLNLPPAAPIQNLEEATALQNTAVQGATPKGNKCPANATCPGNKASKFICKAGYYKKSAKATGCTKCSAGTYSLAGATKCSKCPKGTYSSAGASKCKSCPKKKKPNAAQTACVKA